MPRPPRLAEHTSVNVLSWASSLCACRGYDCPLSIGQLTVTNGSALIQSGAMNGRRCTSSASSNINCPVSVGILRGLPVHCLPVDHDQSGTATASGSSRAVGPVRRAVWRARLVALEVISTGNGAVTNTPAATLAGRTC